MAGMTELGDPKLVESHDVLTSNGIPLPDYHSWRHKSKSHTAKRREVMFKDDFVLVKGWIPSTYGYTDVCVCLKKTLQLRWRTELNTN